MSRKPIALQISLEKKPRLMIQVDMRDGRKVQSIPAVPCTILQHLQAINSLNISSYKYGCVYYTEDPDTLEFLRLHDIEVSYRT